LSGPPGSAVSSRHFNSFSSEHARSGALRQSIRLRGGLKALPSADTNLLWSQPGMKYVSVGRVFAGFRGNR
jgi:hypothetical protein